MGVGLDRKAFRAEIKAISPEGRNRLMRDMKDWLLQANRSCGRWARVNSILFRSALILAVLQILIPAVTGVVRPLTLIILAVWLPLACFEIWLSRRWRRTHPFAAWRMQKDIPTPESDFSIGV